VTAPKARPLLDVASLPDQLSDPAVPAPPLAAQEVALLLVQLIVIVVPIVAVSVVCPFACRLTLGCCGVAAFTVTLVEAAELVPPAPVQVNV
jgi:hypothetical protein